MEKIIKRLGRVFSNYTFILKQVWEAAPLHLSLLIVIAIISAILPLIPLFLMKEVMNVFVNGQADATTMKRIIMLLVATGGINCLARLTDLVKSYFSNITVGVVEKHINLIILNKATTLDMYHVDNKSYYHKLDNAKRSLGRRWDQLVLAPVNLFSHFLTLFSLIAILASLKGWIVGLLVIGVAPNIIIQIKLRELINQFYTGQLDENRKISYLEYVMTNKQYAKEIRIFGLSNTLVAMIKELFEKRHRKFNEVRTKELRWTSLTSSLSFLTIAICQIAIAAMVLKKNISLGDWSLYTGTIQSIVFNLGVVSNIIANSYEEKLFAQVLKEFLELTPHILLTEGESYLASGPSVIEFKNVSFKYPDANEFVLKNLNLKITKGQKIALVGLNGSGKSTLINLLIRLYDPLEGQILFDGVDVRTYKAEDLYKLFGIIFQDFCKYAFTLSDNITISDIDHRHELDRLEQCSRISGVEEIKNQLPEGYGTYITKDYDKNGVNNLSGGQWQKIAIARGIYRNAPIIILDEPTASLDPLAEYEIYEKFVELSEHKTTILISHRLSSVRMVDYIYFISDGQVIESGSHDELMAFNGEYAKLFELQAEKYNMSLSESAS